MPQLTETFDRPGQATAAARSRGRAKGSRTEFWMLLPSIVVLAIISIFPFLFLIYASFMDYSLSIDAPSFAGLDNWRRVFESDTFWQSWGRTAIFGVAGLALELLLGVAVALLLYHAPKGRNLIMTLWMLPLFVAPVVSGLLWKYLLDPTYGLYNWFLERIGIHTQILGDISTAMPAVILMDVWEWTPLITIIVLAGLQSVSQEPLEAAEVDGASGFQKIRFILLPMVRRMIVVALLIRSMDILRYVDTITIATEGGPADSTKTIGYYLMQVAFRFQDMGTAAALGLTMLFVTMVMGNIFVKMMKKGEG
ncbi:sugar ABC transporter permease [Cohnella xylanilytica]|uniref:carbohydrate ABC transporter permease n=1 Tax=Cohnella xylanilytica TaxID=557555 RepID=UPI001B223C3E|nr:sugar ABC transporter permease [Cohnella xylanilytica]GIO11568.1 sugar ABC transporter permease [Cohnella xylanilytica]